MPREARLENFLKKIKKGPKNSFFLLLNYSGASKLYNWGLQILGPGRAPPPGSASETAKCHENGKPLAFHSGQISM